jgi:hypothetical protein
MVATCQFTSRALIRTSPSYRTRSSLVFLMKCLNHLRPPRPCNAGPSTRCSSFLMPVSATTASCTPGSSRTLPKAAVITACCRLLARGLRRLLATLRRVSNATCRKRRTLPCQRPPQLGTSPGSLGTMRRNVPAARARHWIARWRQYSLGVFSTTWNPCNC